VAAGVGLSGCLAGAPDGHLCQMDRTAVREGSTQPDTAVMGLTSSGRSPAPRTLPDTNHDQTAAPHCHVRSHIREGLRQCLAAVRLRRPNLSSVVERTQIESDNPQEPRPVDRRANPPAPRPIGPLGVISAPRNSLGLPEPRSRESRPMTRRSRDLTTETGIAHTHRPAVRHLDPSALLAGAPIRISRSSLVAPRGSYAH